MNELAWIAEIPEDEIRAALPESVAEVADLVGLDACLRLHEHYGGLSVYFRKLDQIFRGLRDDRIRAEFNGSNYVALARQYRLTESRVRDIVAGRSELTQETMFE